MTKVFVVTSGEYSDYRITGVFSTKAKAERAIRELPIRDTNDNIEEYELDELDALVNKFARGYRIYWVTMNTDGTVTAAHQDDGVDTWINHNKQRNMIWGKVLAKSDEHAVKIVNEKRGQLIAAGEL